MQTKKSHVGPIENRSRIRLRSKMRANDTSHRICRASISSNHIRIAKAIARAGLCSRREAERWVLDGRVAVNDVRILSPALNVGPDDKVVIDGKLLPEYKETALWRYFKPKGLVTTHRDPQNRPTVFQNLPQELPRVLSIGRLDFNSEGLLLLTTDGGLARYIELPSTGWIRRYRVRAYGCLTEDVLKSLHNGVEIDGVRYGPIEAKLDSVKGNNCWISIGIREGKNREVRKILSSYGLQVNRLIRVSFGPFQLLDLKPGQVAPVKRRVLIDQLGKNVAEKFGLQALPSVITSKSPKPAFVRKVTKKLNCKRRKN
ncbi:MAG: hypothetical protein TECD_00281 [Hyphomicrobiaceae bacterium hypho_1]